MKPFNLAAVEALVHGYPLVGVTGGYCPIFRAGEGNRKVAGAPLAMGPIQEGLGGLESRLFPEGSHHVDHTSVKKEAVPSGRVIGMAS